MKLAAQNAELFDPELAYDSSWEDDSLAKMDPVAEEIYLSAYWRSSKISSTDRAKLHRKWLLSLKLGKPCTDCNLVCANNNYPAFHWDHLPQHTKLFEISESARRSKKAVLEEIAKCELRCANCHAIITHERKYGKLPLVKCLTENLEKERE